MVVILQVVSNQIAGNFNSNTKPIVWSVHNKCYICLEPGRLGCTRKCDKTTPIYYGRYVPKQEYYKNDGSEDKYRMCM